MTTPNLGLVDLVAAQSQPHIPINTSLRRIDAAVQLAVIAIENDPPAGSPGPNEGDRYIVGTGPSGEWGGHEGDVAMWVEDAWLYLVPQPGWIAYDADQDTHLAYVGGSPATWIALSLGGGGGGGSPELARIFEDFIHSPSTTPYAGWDYVVSSGSVSLQAPFAVGSNAAGIWTLVTGTNINGYAAVYYGNGGAQPAVCPAQGPIRIRARIQAKATLSSAGTPSVLRIGLASTFSSNLVHNHGIFIEVSNDSGSGDAPRFRGYSMDGSAELDFTGYGGTVTEDEWYTVELIGSTDGNEFEAFLNGASLGTFDTSGSDTYQLGVVHGKTGSGADSVQWDIDYYLFEQALDRT